MKKLLWFSLFIFACICSRAQEVVFDPQHLAAVLANGSVRSGAEATHNQYLGKINNNINDLNTNVGTVVLAQTIIYNALADVNSALKDGLAVKNMAVTIADMESYIGQCLELAKSEPYLLLLATNFESSMQARAVSLLADVSGFVMKEGGNVLADYNARDQLLRKVTMDLQIMDGLAYGAWRAMYWAKERGIIASINPYAAWVSKDKAFVSQIIANAKYLNQ